MKDEQEDKIQAWGKYIFEVVKGVIGTVEGLENLQVLIRNLSHDRKNLDHQKRFETQFELPHTIKLVGLFGDYERLNDAQGSIFLVYQRLFNTSKLPSEGEVNQTFKHLIDRLQKPVQKYLKNPSGLKRNIVCNAVRRFVNWPTNVPLSANLHNLLKKLPFAYFELLASYPAHRTTQTLDEQVLKAFFPLHLSPLLDTKYFPGFVRDIPLSIAQYLENYDSLKLELEINCLYGVLDVAIQSGTADIRSPYVKNLIVKRDTSFKQFYECYTAFSNDAATVKSVLDSEDGELQKRALKQLVKKALIAEEHLALVIGTYPYTDLISRGDFAQILTVLKKARAAHKKDIERKKTTGSSARGIRLPVRLIEQRKQLFEDMRWDSLVLESLDQIKAFSKKKVIEESLKIGYDKESISGLYAKDNSSQQITIAISNQVIRRTERLAKKCGMNLQEYYNFALNYRFDPSMKGSVTIPKMSTDISGSIEKNKEDESADTPAILQNSEALNEEGKQQDADTGTVTTPLESSSGNDEQSCEQELSNSLPVTLQSQEDAEKHKALSALIKQNLQYNDPHYNKENHQNPQVVLPNDFINDELPRGKELTERLVAAFDARRREKGTSITPVSYNRSRSVLVKQK